MTTAPTTDTIRVVVADDQPLMRRAIADLISDEPGFKLAGQAENGEEVLGVVEQTHPDIVLMDLDMPVKSGVDAIAELSSHSSVKCIALTTFSSMEWVLSALRAGASGFLVKDAAPDMIADSIRQVMEDTMILSPSVVELLADRVTQLPDTASVQPSDEAPELTEREQQVINLLAGGLNNREIAEELFLSEGSVKLHLGKACDRLGARDRVQLLVRAVELGLASPALIKPETAQDRYL